MLVETEAVTNCGGRVLSLVVLLETVPATNCGGCVLVLYRCRLEAPPGTGSTPLLPLPAMFGSTFAFLLCADLDAGEELLSSSANSLRSTSSHTGFSFLSCSMRIVMFRFYSAVLTVTKNEIHSGA